MRCERRAQHYKHIVHLVEKYARKSHAKARLPLLYVIDSICRQSQQKNAERDPFTRRCARETRIRTHIGTAVRHAKTHPLRLAIERCVLAPTSPAQLLRQPRQDVRQHPALPGRRQGACADLAAPATHDLTARRFARAQPSAFRVVSVWKEKGVFERTVCDELQEVIDAVRTFRRGDAERIRDWACRRGRARCLVTPRADRATPPQDTRAAAEEEEATGEWARLQHCMPLTRRASQGLQPLRRQHRQLRRRRPRPRPCLQRPRKRRPHRARTGATAGSQERTQAHRRGPRSVHHPGRASSTRLARPMRSRVHPHSNPGAHRMGRRPSVSRPIHWVRLHSNQPDTLPRP
jgi:hypothetical protein